MLGIRRMLWKFIGHLLLAAASCAVIGVAQLAHGQTGYPNRPIRMIVPYAPGGNVDINARYLARKLGDSLGVPVVIENKGGASSIIGTDMLAKSTPDGYTIMLVGAGGTTHTVNPSLFSKLPYDSIRDFAPVSLFSRVPMVLTVTPSLPATTASELIALAKAKPGSLNAATGGDGTASNLGAQMLMTSSGAQFELINYKGNAPAQADTVAGVTQILFDTLATVLPQIKAGRLRPLGVTSAERSPLIPDVPTLKEAGFPGLDMSVYLGVLAPAGTPPEIVNKLASEIAAVTRDPEARQHFARQATDLISDTPEEFAAFIKADIERWEKITRETGIKKH